MSMVRPLPLNLFAAAANSGSQSVLSRGSYAVKNHSKGSNVSGSNILTKSMKRKRAASAAAFWSSSQGTSSTPIKWDLKVTGVQCVSTVILSLGQAFVDCSDVWWTKLHWPQRPQAECSQGWLAWGQVFAFATKYRLRFEVLLFMCSFCLFSCFFVFFAFF